jgi:hypothetical protein
MFFEVGPEVKGIDRPAAFSLDGGNFKSES